MESILNEKTEPKQKVPPIEINPIARGATFATYPRKVIKGNGSGGGGTIISKVHPGKWARNHLFISNDKHPIQEADGGLTDLKKVQYSVRHSGGLNLYPPLAIWEVTAYLYQWFLHQKAKKKRGESCAVTTTPPMVYDGITNNGRFITHKTTVNHVLNQLTAIGVLDVKKTSGMHQAQVNYYFTNFFLNSGGFEWYFTPKNLKRNGGVFKRIEGAYPSLGFGLAPTGPFLDQLMKAGNGINPNWIETEK